MKLSQRLETVASFVPRGSNVADIGTDHGYVPIYLVRHGMAERALAMDVRTGPLNRAAEHIKEKGLEERIQVRLSDGLKQLMPGEADCVVMAGMGGELMIRIMTEGRRFWDSVPYWVLSPHSEVSKVRRFLREQSFSVWREEMVKEEGKFYTVLGAGRPALAGGDLEPSAGARENPGGSVNRELEDLYGRLLLFRQDPVLEEYLEKEHGKLEGILTGLAGEETVNAGKRKAELLLKLQKNEEAQDEMRRNH